MVWGAFFQTGSFHIIRLQQRHLQRDSAQTEPISRCDNDSGDPVRVSVIADNQNCRNGNGVNGQDEAIRAAALVVDDGKITAGGTNERVSRIVLLFNATDLAHLQSRRIHSLTD
jgi:hypothetical protein